mgnify:FL=1
MDNPSSEEKNKMRKIDPSEYMVDGWDSVPPGYVTKYRRGSRHNKIGMTIMWSYYILVILMVIRLIVVLNS